MNKTLAIAAVMAAGALAACAPYDTTSPNDYPRDVHDTHAAPGTSPGIGSPARNQEPDERITGHHWKLDRAVDAMGNTDPNWLRPSTDPITLTFGDQNLSVAGLCNQMNASYNVNGSAIHISQLNSTMRMCPDESMMRYEQAIGQRLPQANAWHVTRLEKQSGLPALTLQFQDGAQWVLTGVPTSAAQYGSPGQIEFIEVAPQTVPCADPSTPQRQCLYVRSVSYDAAGMKQGYGPWEPFYGYIEGYQHEPGMRNVLRVKRYTVQNPPADAGRYAYVLDLVVESQVQNINN